MTEKFYCTDCKAELTETEIHICALFELFAICGTCVKARLAGTQVHTCAPICKTCGDAVPDEEIQWELDGICMGCWDDRAKALGIYDC